MTTADDKPARPGRLSGAFLLMMGGRVVGVALSPMLLAHAPLALIALSPVIAHMVLVAAVTSPPGYYAVAAGVSTAQCALGYAFGRAEGVRAGAFLVRRGVASEASVGRLLALLRTSAPLLLFAIPGPIVSALAGASRSPPRLFVPAIVVSQVLWAVLCRIFGEALLTWIAQLRAGVVRYVWPLTALTVAITVWKVVRSRRERDG